MTESQANPFVSRGGIKLAAALDAFKLDVTGLTCVDLGCNVGGFTDCLLRRGADRVFAIDTGYGELAWKLRNDERVIVMERTNAMHVDVEPVLQRAAPPAASTPLFPSAPSPNAVDLAVIDLGWTPQKHAIPAAMRWRPGRLVTLIKPHYEWSETLPRGAVLSEAQARESFQRVIAAMPDLGVRVVGTIVSPIRGGRGKGKTGNVEYLAMLEPLDAAY